MNGDEENYHPLDIGLVCYPPEDIGLTNVAGRLNEKEVGDKVPKGPGVEETNPTDIYLYDLPQMSRPDAKNRTKEDFESTAKSKSNDSTPSKPENIESSIQQTQVTRHGSSQNLLLGISNEQEQSCETGKSKRTAGSGLIDSGFASKENDLKSTTTSPNGPVTTMMTAPATSMIPSNDLTETVEQPFYVNAKQYYRILKRRYARAKLEENLRISRERKPYLHESRHKHAMRRPRGQGGRFLTIAEIEALKNKKESTSSTPSIIDTPVTNVEDEKRQNSNVESTVINQQETGNNKLACIKKK